MENPNNYKTIIRKIPFRFSYAVQILLLQNFCYLNRIYFDSCTFDRYAYSEDASEEFDKDDTLTLIKPFPMPSVDARSPEVRQVHAGNGLSNGDLEEDKTE